MFRIATLSDFGAILRLGDIPAQDLETHFQNEAAEGIIYGEIEAFAFRLKYENSLFMFDWIGKDLHRVKVLRHILSGLNPKMPFLGVFISPKDIVGREILKNHHFIQDRWDKEELWFHRYHPDNFYYEEAYLGHSL